MLNSWPPIYMESDKGMGVSRYKTSYGMSLHSHNYFELEYPFAGNCRQVFKNDSFEFTRGDIAFFKPESRHAFFVSDEAKMLRITIKPTYMPKIYDRFENEFSNMNIIRIPSNEVKRVEGILLAIEKEFERQNDYYSEVISAYLDVLFALLIRFNQESEFEEKKSYAIDFKVFLTYIDNNLKTVTPSGVAEYSGYNFPYFSKLFKKNIGVNLSEYINLQKLELASKLLLETRKSIEFIGYEVGFNHKSYFHRIFKRYYGVTPEEYRKTGGRLKKYTDETK